MRGGGGGGGFLRARSTTLYVFVEPGFGPRPIGFFQLNVSQKVQPTCMHACLSLRQGSPTPPAGRPALGSGMDSG